MNTATRTFDCPWCGAINPVPTEHLGEHFVCPECRKSTKVTERNTSAGLLTDAPPDAPHLSGERTFDCPWCGAISAVPSTHLGARFVCPECRKDTKLTSTNTQRAPVTVPPPDAPHVEPSSKGFWIVLVLVAAAGVAWFLLRGGEEPPPAGPGSGAVVPRPGTPSEAPSPAPVPTPEAPTPPVEPAPAMPSPSGPPRMPTPGMTEVAPPMPSPGMTEGPPPMPAPGMTEAAPPPPAESEAVVRARAVRDAAAATFASATTAHGRAAAAIEAWTRTHPGAAEAARDLPVLEQMAAEASRLLADPSVVKDPARPTPAEVRAVRDALRTFVEASPERIGVAQRALAAMRLDLGGREVAGVAEWREIPFASEGFRRAAARLLEAARATAVPADLLAAHVAATKDLDAARAALDAAEAAWKAAEGGGK